MGRLEDRVALVFGASPHIAGTTAHWFAKEGAKVAVADRKTEVAQRCVEFLRGKGYDAHALVGDPTEERQAEQLVAEAVSHYGRVDIMFNQVGSQYRHTVLHMNLHDWNKSLGGYLTGGMLTTKYTARAMVELGIPGSIIHIVSDAGHEGEAGNTAYNAAKGGLLHFCRGAAMELARNKIRVNTISPTFMDHLLWQYPAKMLNPRVHGPNTMSADDFLQGIPLGRFCNARDIANAAVFLASDESSFMTGQDVMLDGGARAGYFCWQPGVHAGITTADAIRDLEPHQFGEPAPQIKINY
jgi:NAD(P)-dependent dehydrogenase (short-subunit alcohol dehydrogenase family)